MLVYHIELEEHADCCRWWASFGEDLFDSGVQPTPMMALEAAQVAVDLHAAGVWAVAA